MTRTKRAIWTFRPDIDTQSLISKAVNDLTRKLRRKGHIVDGRGIRSEIINEALRNHLKEFTGKRESNRSPVNSPLNHLHD